jgi:toxin FitB
MIVLDTNVISEVIKPDPSGEVTSWVAFERPSNIFTTTISQAELLYGIELMPKGRRRSMLQAAILRILTEVFADRILPFDSDAAEIYARIAPRDRKTNFASGRPNRGDRPFAQRHAGHSQYRRLRALRN